jgi:hypothetical protein
MMKFELARLPEYDDRSIIAELQRVAALVAPDLKMTRARFNELAKVSSSAVCRRFGSWREALVKAGLSDRYSGRTVSNKMKTQAARDMSDEKLRQELRRVASSLGSETLTQAQFNSMSRVSASAISRRFAGWNKALRDVGLRPVNMGRRYSEGDYFEDLLVVWTRLGRQPKYGEMNCDPSVISAGAYEKRWGTWTKTLLAFLRRVNSDQDEESVSLHDTECHGRPVRTVSPKQEDQHKIGLALRYKVLTRDNFRCVACGNSRATDPMCKLHVDHILPFSKKGKTVESNLRSLCSKCNIGKGNRVETV